MYMYVSTYLCTSLSVCGGCLTLGKIEDALHLFLSTYLFNRGRG